MTMRYSHNRDLFGGRGSSPQLVKMNETLKHGPRQLGVMLGPAAPIRELISEKQVSAQFMPVKMKTGSRLFGDQLQDYVLLCKNLANFRLNRVKANELNIYARGGASHVKEHLNAIKQ